MKKKIILFGAGSFGKKALDYYVTKENVSIVAFCDNNKYIQQSVFWGIKVIAPNELVKEKYDEIVVCSSFDDEICKQLLSMSISPDQINVFHSNQKNIQLNDGKKLLMAEDIMFKLSILFNENSIEYHIDHGTLLGIIRDKKILPWDIDVDFAIPDYEKENTIKVLENYLNSYHCIYCEKNNWKCRLTHQQMKLGKVEKNLPMMIQVFNDVKDGVSDMFTLDIELKHHYQNKIYWMVGSRRLSSETSLCFPTAFIAFKNHQLKIPNNTKQYLETLYGNWEKPVKQWHYDRYANIT